MSEVESAKAALEADQRKREEVCKEAMAKVLKEHRCVIDVSVTIRANQVSPMIHIVAEP